MHLCCHSPHCRSSRWGTDPLFRGSYSYIPSGALPADVAALAAPILSAGNQAPAAAASGPPVLLFAGEACHVKYIGTMHGAALTGQAAAAELLAAWRRTSSCVC